MNDIISYLNEKQIPYTPDGAEVIIKCPNCSKEKLYINIDTELFHCFRCEIKDPESPFAKGHFSRLKETWGDILPVSSIFEKKNQKEVNLSDLVETYHKDLLNNRKAIKYLLKRGISERSIYEFKLGYVNKYNQDWISIPSFEQNIPKLIKYRKLPPDVTSKLDKYIREKDSKSILFNGDIIEKYDEIFILEGEFDAIALHQWGYKNVVGITGGAGTLLPEWYDKLRLKPKIFLVFDFDDEGQGQKAAERVWATRLGKNKCWNIVLPKDYDMNSYCEKYEKKDFEKLIKESKKFRIDGVLSLEESFLEMYKKSRDDDAFERFAFPWPSVNKLFNGGLAKERLLVLSGIPGVGKTSMGIAMCHHFAKVYKIPSLFFCMEMLEVDLATKIIQIEKDLTFNEIDFSDALIYAAEMEDLPLYFGYSQKVTPQVFYNTMKECRDRFGVEFGVFDNLQRMIRTGNESDTAVASGIFKDITMDFRIPFVLISHLRRLEEEREPRMDDLKGSQSIPADADHHLLLHRKRIPDESGSYEYLDPETKAIVDKSRFSVGGRTKLYFEGAKSKFRELLH